MNKIILTADAELEDKEAREWLSLLQTKVDTINERTKALGSYIRDMARKYEKLKGGKDEDEN